MKQRSVKILLLVLVMTLTTCFFIFDLGRFFDLQFIKAQRDAFQNYYAHHPAITITTYVVVYIAVTALSLPGAAILTLIGGALFGLVTGTILVSFCSTIGATFAFLVARSLLRDSIQNKFGDRLEAINKGIEKEGMFYLFTMRLIPAIPFFVINLVMGLTPIRTVQFFFVSQLGMFPGTVVYVNAGTQLAQLDSLAGVLSPQLILSFVLLGLFPLIAKKTIEFVNRRREAKEGSTHA
jgi:uncharacterized membrane protein YdjX (TVP38/TMEM64 family)